VKNSEGISRFVIWGAKVGAWGGERCYLWKLFDSISVKKTAVFWGAVDNHFGGPVFSVKRVSYAILRLGVVAIFLKN
jgi:hypothetical protein